MEQLAKFDLADIITKLQELNKLKETLKEVSKEVSKEEKPISWLNGDGNKLYDQWLNEDEVLHRVNGPALIDYKNNVKYRESWYLNGSLRLNEVSIIQYYPNGRTEKEFWLYEDGCYIVNRYNVENGQIYKEFWSSDIKFKGFEMDEYKLHRKDDLPAVIHYHENGNMEQQTWYLDGKKHRLSKPAVITYNGNGCVLITERYINGGLYVYIIGENDKQPAIISYYPGTTNIKEKVYIRYKDVYDCYGERVVVTFNENRKKISKTYFIGDKKMEEIKYTYC